MTRTFDSEVEAFQAFKVAREGKINKLADDYRGLLDPRAYSALLTWEVNIDD